MTEMLAIGAQAGCQHLSVKTVVLSTGWRHAVAEPVQLHGVDRIHFEIALHQGFHHRSVRHLNRGTSPHQALQGAGISGCPRLSALLQWVFRFYESVNTRCKFQRIPIRFSLRAAHFVQSELVWNQSYAQK